MDPFHGILNGTDSADAAKVRITLDADRADLLVGGNGRGGDLVLADDAGAARIRLDAGGAEKSEGPALVPTQAILLSGDTGTIVAGGLSQQGSLVLKRSFPDPLNSARFISVPAISLTAKEASASIGGPVDGSLKILDRHDKERIRLGGDDQDLTMLADDGTTIVNLGHEGNLTLGGAGKDGDLFLHNSKGEIRVHITGGGGATSETATVFLNGAEGDMSLGGNQTNGHVSLNDTKGQVRISIAADGGQIRVRNAKGDVSVVIDGESGDITLPNADCAEDFELSGGAGCEPGTVMVFDGLGRLHESTKAYDRKVAGVLSGAGSFRPGIVLDRHPASGGRRPLALAGKVYCKVDADYSTIEAGDLLTTSPTSGHAMKASDPMKAFGAVIGKALVTFATGKGLIPILVALQ